MIVTECYSFMGGQYTLYIKDEKGGSHKVWVNIEYGKPLKSYVTRGAYYAHGADAALVRKLHKTAKAHVRNLIGTQVAK